MFDVSEIKGLLSVEIDKNNRKKVRYIIKTTSDDVTTTLELPSEELAKEFEQALRRVIDYQKATNNKSIKYIKELSKSPSLISVTINATDDTKLCFKTIENGKVYSHALQFDTQTDANKSYQILLNSIKKRKIEKKECFNCDDYFAVHEGSGYIQYSTGTFWVCAECHELEIKYRKNKNENACLNCECHIPPSSPDSIFGICSECTEKKISKAESLMTERKCPVCKIKFMPDRHCRMFVNDDLNGEYYCKGCTAKQLEINEICFETITNKEND